MEARANDINILENYKVANPEERFEIMFAHYSFFPSISMNVDVAALSDGETYGIVRDHNGVLTELEATYVDGVLTFETNQFSTYTLIKKSAASAVPKTGDSSNVMLWIE